MKDLVQNWKLLHVEGQHSKSPATNRVVGKEGMKEKDSIYFFSSYYPHPCPFHFHTLE